MSAEDVVLSQQPTSYNPSDVIAYGEDREGVKVTIYASNPPYGPTDVVLEIAVFESERSADLSMSSSGAATCSFDMGNQRSVQSTSHGVASVTQNYLSSPLQFACTSNGRAGCTNNYLGSPLPIACASHGVGHMVDYLGSPLPIAMLAAGVAHWTSNYLSSTVPLGTTTSNGQAGCTANYLGSPHYVSSTSNGRAGCTSNYLGATVKFQCRSDGIGELYIGAEFAISCTSNGIATCDIDPGPKRFSATTSNGVATITASMGGPVRLSVTVANGIANVAAYLSGPVPIACTSHGVGHVVTYVSGPLDMDNIIVHASSTMSAYLAGPIPITATANGVGHVEFAASTLSVVMRGVATMHATMQSHGGELFATINAGCYPYGPFLHPTPALVFDLWGGHVALALQTIEGEATFVWGLPEFAFVCNAGCRAFGDPFFFGVIFLPFGGVFAQLRNNTNFTDHFPFGTSTPTGVGIMVAGFPNSAMVINAGCRAFDTYTADMVLQPPFYALGTGPDFRPSIAQPIPGGVFAVMFAPHTYLDTEIHAGARVDPDTHQSLGVFAYLSSRVYYEFASHGVGHLEIHPPMTWIIHGVGGFDNNYINVPSYDLQSFQSDGVGHMALVAPEVRGVAFVSHGVGGMLAYVSSKVYFEATSHGVAGCTRNAFEAARWQSNGGVYPYFIVTTLHPGIEITMSQPARALATTSNGIANFTAELVGPKFLVVVSHGVGHMIPNLQNNIGKFSMTINAGSKLHQVAEGSNGAFFSIPLGVWFAFGVVMTLQPDPKWAFFNGVGHMTANLNYTFILRWQQRGDPPLDYGPNEDTVAEGGVGGMILETRWFLQATTKTNLDYLIDDGHYLYPPDAWHMVVAWALELRTRGRTRMYFDFSQIAGNLLAMFFSIPQPQQPNIDGDASLAAMAGQYWPRHIKLPFRNVVPATHPYIWRDYEYWRR